jgi:hypothetical protein
VPGPPTTRPPRNELLDSITLYGISDEYILYTYQCKLPTSNELCGKVIDYSGTTKK